MAKSTKVINYHSNLPLLSPFLILTLHFPIHPRSSDTPESIHALFYGNLAQSNEEATRISDRVQLNIERSIIHTSGSQQL